MTASQYNRELLNWATKLTEFELEIQYKKGELNMVADCLSRGGENQEDAAAVPPPSRKGGGGDVGKRPT